MNKKELQEALLQSYIDSTFDKMREKRQKTQMTLGKLIKLLEQMNPEDKIICSTDTSIRFTSFDSYRGYYEDLALGYIAADYYDERTNDTINTVGQFLAEAKSCLNKNFYGWKGGEFLMTENTPLWVANNGHTSHFVIAKIEEFSGNCFVYLAIKDDD